MNVLGQAFFGVCALCALGGALATVLAKNPIRGAMGLLLTIAGITGFFLSLNAQFLAAIQLIVYAGAVVILFVFVIMLIGPDATPSPDARAAFSRTLAGVLMAAGALVTTVFLARSSGGLHFFAPARPELGSIDAVGRELYTRGIVPFELTTALFIVAVVGAVATASGKASKNARGRPSPEPPAKAPLEQRGHHGSA